MDAKGQVSAEYILIIFVVIIILSSVTLPLVGNSTKASMDISKTSDVSTAVNSIANAVNIVYSNGPGAKRTLSVYIPVDGKLNSNSNVLNMYVTGVAKNSSIPLNDSDDSTKEIVTASVPYDVKFNTTSNAATGYTVPITKSENKWYTVEVQWFVNDKFVTVTIDE